MPLPHESSAKQIGNLVPLKFPAIDKRSSSHKILVIDRYLFEYHFFFSLSQFYHILNKKIYIYLSIYLSIYTGGQERSMNDLVDAIINSMKEA